MQKSPKCGTCLTNIETLGDLNGPWYVGGLKIKEFQSCCPVVPAIYPPISPRVFYRNL